MLSLKSAIKRIKSRDTFAQAISIWPPMPKSWMSSTSAITCRHFTRPSNNHGNYLVANELRSSMATKIRLVGHEVRSSTVTKIRLVGRAVTQGSVIAEPAGGSCQIGPYRQCRNRRARRGCPSNSLNAWGRVHRQGQSGGRRCYSRTGGSCRHLD